MKNSVKKNKIPFFIKLVCCGLIIFNSAHSAASNPDQILVHLIKSVQSLPLQERIYQLSEIFLGKPYLLESLGEGVEGEFNKNLLYRLNAFDCETYVDTIMALALSRDLSEFKHLINKIRYKDGKVSFQSRNHFTSKDWIPNNEQSGFIENLTFNIAGDATIASKVIINQLVWYRHLLPARIVRPDLTPAQRKIKLLQLHALVGAEATVAKIDFVPITLMLANPQIINKIPNAAIVFLVLENPYQKQLLGTENNISHMGLAIWKNGKLYLRSASSKRGQVVDEPLLEYLAQYLPGTMLKGISIWKITRPQSSYF